MVGNAFNTGAPLAECALPHFFCSTTLHRDYAFPVPVDKVLWQAFLPWIVFLLAAFSRVFCSE